MFNTIKRFIEIERLSKELIEKEKEIENLKWQLSRVNTAPTFFEVAKKFDVSFLSKNVMGRVVEQFTPMLEREILKALKDISFEYQNKQPRMEMYVARTGEAARMPVYYFRFQMEAKTIEFKTVL